MKISDKGLSLIKKFEGCRLAAYPDPATGGKPWTIGYGHTDRVNKNDSITQSQADQFLREDLAHIYTTIGHCVKRAVNQNQFDALCSFIFNVGEGNFTCSTLLNKLNNGDFRGTGDEFLRWNRAAGRVMSGLTKRREAERTLFLS